MTVTSDVTVNVTVNVTSTVAPLVAPEIDLRDFEFMPLDVARLRDSDLAAVASGDGFRAAVLLWCASWHQVPASSLPSDDRMLARLAGFGRDTSTWESIKADALRGFILCSDGRLYHPVIAKKADEAWNAKLKRRERVRAAIEAKKSHHKRDDDRNNQRYNHRVDDRHIKRGDNRNNQRDGQRDGQRNELQGTVDSRYINIPPNPPLDIARLADEFYEEYPKKVDPKDAKAKFVRAVKAGADPLKIVAAAKRWAEAWARAGTDKQYIPAPAVWLNKGRYDSEDLPGLSFSASAPPNGANGHGHAQPERKVDFGGGVEMSESSLIEFIAWCNERSASGLPFEGSFGSLKNFRAELRRCAPELVASLNMPAKTEQGTSA